MPGYTRREILAGLGAFAGLQKACSPDVRLTRERAVAILEATWATGSQAGNALRLRGELAIHLAGMEHEHDGRAITDSFINKMEGMIVGARQAHFAFGNQTLVRYLQAQLRVLRDELRRVRADS